MFAEMHPSPPLSPYHPRLLTRPILEVFALSLHIVQSPMTIVRLFPIDTKVLYTAGGRTWRACEIYQVIVISDIIPCIYFSTNIL